MRGYYIQFDNNLDVNLSKKINAQIREFKKIGDIEHLKADASYSSVRVSKVLSRIPVLNFPRFAYDKVFEQLDSPDYIYFRKVSTDINIIRFLKRIKTEYPKCKIIIELYTYPYYRDSYFNLYNFHLIARDAFFSRYYKKCVDRFVTYSLDDEIFGIKTIKTKNGIDIDECTAIVPKQTDDEIHLLAVAIFRKQHGYERVIKGLNKYYSNGGKRKVKIYMVGNGPETERYRRDVINLNLEDKVEFLGLKKGKELEEIYAKSDIGLGPFGLYKIRVELASALKTREYLAKGLPLIAGCKQDVFPQGSNKYYLEFSNDDSVVDFDEIIRFYDNIYLTKKTNRQTIIEDIRKFATENISISIVFKPIIDYLANS